MLFIEIVKVELTGGNIEIMLIMEITTIELTGGHIGIMLIIEINKIELLSLALDISLQFMTSYFSLGVAYNILIIKFSSSLLLKCRQNG